MFPVYSSFFFSFFFWCLVFSTQYVAVPMINFE